MKNGDVPIRYVNVYQAGYPSSGMTFFRVELVESCRVPIIVQGSLEWRCSMPGGWNSHCILLLVIIYPIGNGNINNQNHISNDNHIMCFMGYIIVIVITIIITNMIITNMIMIVNIIVLHYTYKYAPLKNHEMPTKPYQKGEHTFLLLNGTQAEWVSGPP